MDTSEIALDCWAAWAPGLESHEDWLLWARGEKLPQQDGAPAVGFFPAAHRRRLSRLGKMAVYVAHQCGAPASQSHRLVFASRYGEQHRTARILDDITRGEPVSPTAFSLSVHNAVAGLYSMVSGNQAPTTSLSAGENTFAAGWIEAVGLLGSPGNDCEAVTLVYYEEPLPPDYQEFQSEALFPMALALNMRHASHNDTEAYSLCMADQESTTGISPPWQPLAFIRLMLNQNQQTEGTGSGSRWIWKRNEKL